MKRIRGKGKRFRAGMVLGALLAIGASAVERDELSENPQQPVLSGADVKPSVPAPAERTYAIPLAFTLLGWGIPYTRGWNIYGVRVNTCLPGWNPGHRDVYGIDAGISGEAGRNAGGISCNLLDNSCDRFGGIQVGGVYNRIKEFAPFGLQATLGHNRANRMNGIQVGTWNAATSFHGLQIGLLVNYAGSGAGLQIGLWNQCGEHGSPILGAIF